MENNALPEIITEILETIEYEAFGTTPYDEDRGEISSETLEMVADIEQKILSIIADHS
tara:strand:- start:11183 stop:11356 length:174 start_codon:yes stop_codon:yes gene_type:complete